jgi:hypothetical protein
VTSEKPTHLKKNFRSANLSTTNPSWPDSKSNTSSRDGKLEQGICLCLRRKSPDVREIIL